MRASVNEHRPAVLEQPNRTTTTALRPAGATAWRLASIALWVVAISLCAILVFANLEKTPRTWFDEGSHLHVPKALVQTGRYADRSSEGFRAFGPTIGVGPTVMLPIAAVFKLGGISLLSARLVIVAYMLLALAAFALLMNRLAGRRIAILSTVLLLASPGLDFIRTGRQVLGEVPAFAFLLCGLLVWFARDDRTGTIMLTRCTKRCLIAGGLFGLTIITKSQLGIVLVPSLAILALLALRWEKRIGLKQVVVPLIVMLFVFAGWEGALLTIVTGGSLSQNLTLLRQASGGSLIVIAPQRMIIGARFLIGPHAFFALLVPALAYGCVRVARRKMQVGELVLLTFSVVGLAWFVCASVAWPRYAFVPLALAALPIARLVADSASALWRGGGIQRGITLVAVVVLAAVVGASFAGQLRATLATPDDAPQQMARYLESNVPTTTVIETWEPELGFLTDHRYHFPDPAYLDRAVRHEWLGAPAITGYDVGASGASYLVIGPFARYTGIYDESAIAARYRQIAVVGDYTLYQLTPGTAATEDRKGAPI